MPIEEVRYFFVTCDECDRLYENPEYGNSSVEEKQEVVDNGWKLELGFELEDAFVTCPECQKPPLKFMYAGKLGPWARCWFEGCYNKTRYLDIGTQGHPDYKEISAVDRECGSWRFVRVFLTECESKSCFSNTNIYKKL